MSIEAVVARVALLQSTFRPVVPAATATPNLSATAGLASTGLGASAATSGGSAKNGTFAAALGTAMSSSAAAPAATPSAAPAGTYANLSGDLDGNPELLARLQTLAASRGETWTVTSGLRTHAEQARLWASRHNNPYPVARPGTSLHHSGNAADVTIGGRAIQDVVPAGELRAAGLEPLLGDSVHVELGGARA